MSDFPPAGMIEGEDSQYFSIKHRSNTVSSGMEDGYEITRPRSTRRPGRIFSSGFTEITNADKALLESFWEGVGTYQLFTWTDPTSGVERTVRFDGELDFSYEGIGGYHLWIVKFDLKEV